MAVVAAFSADTVLGTKPFRVQFTDESTGAPDTWAWDFGDTGTSTSQSPEHIYTSAGTYTVTLTATLGGDSDIETKVAYVVVITNVIARPSILYSGVREAYFEDGWINDKHFLVSQALAYPCTVQFVDLYCDTTNE